MKLGVCLEMFFADRPFSDRMAAAAEAGCRYAEMWFADRTAWSGGMKEDDAKDPAEIRGVAEQTGLTMTNMVIGSPDGSIGGGLTDPTNRPAWLARTEKSLTFCREAGIGAAIVCTGNNIVGRSRPDMRRSVIDGLRETVEKAEQYDVNLWLEPLNDKIDHPDYMLTGSDEAAGMVREIGSPRLKLLFDCYHMQIMEGDLCGHIRENLDTIGHIHAAGHPGRHEVWQGETDYPFLAKQIDAMGYDGVFALEYLPTLDSGESLRRAMALLGLEGES